MWIRRWYLERARWFAVGGLEIQDFIDVVIRDLGLEVERKRGRGRGSDLCRI